MKHSSENVEVSKRPEKLKIHICSLLKSSSGKRTTSYLVYIIFYVIPVSINFILPSLKPKKMVHISPWPDFPKGSPNLPQVLIVSVEGDDILFDDKRWSCGGDLHPPWESWDPPDLTLGVWICENFRYQNKSHSGKVTQWLAIFLVVVKMLLPKKAVLWYTIPLGPASFSIVLQTHQNHTITWLWLTRAPVGWLASWLQFKLDHLHTTKYREFWMSLCVRVIPPSTDASTQCDFYGPHTVQL